MSVIEKTAAATDATYKLAENLINTSVVLSEAANHLKELVDHLKELSEHREGEPAPAVSKPLPEPTGVSLEDVRAVLATKSQQGYTAGVREIIEQHGATKLSEINPKDYAAILALAEVLGDG